MAMVYKALLGYRGEDLWFKNPINLFIISTLRAILFDNLQAPGVSVHTL
jgi:hypothetical protein